MTEKLVQSVFCPWCNKGEVIMEDAVAGILSVKCPKCQHVFRIHLDTLTAEKALACNRTMKSSYKLKIGSIQGKPRPSRTVTD